MAARKVWKISVSQVALFARMLEFTDNAWIELPADHVFKLTVGEQVVLRDGVKVRPSNRLAVKLMVPGVLVLPAEDGISGSTLELPIDTTLHFAVRTITLQPDGTSTPVKPGTEIVWPGVRGAVSALQAEHNVIDHESGEGLFWLRAG